MAAATCARLASATIDYISKGHFREFLFGLEQHSLGEPWPDVLGVTIILVVTVLFMMGLEASVSCQWTPFCFNGFFTEICHYSVAFVSGAAKQVCFLHSGGEFPYCAQFSKLGGVLKSAFSKSGTLFV